MVNGMRVLYAGYDAELRRNLTKQWAGDGGGGEIIEAQSYVQAIEKGTKGLFVFMIVELALSGGSGSALCRVFREAGVTCPILIVSSSNSDADAIASLGAGANDYVTKPFSYAVLAARIEAQLRSHRSSEKATYAIGPYTFRPSDKMLLENNRKIRLTEKESNVLKHLLRSGKTVSREALLSEVWGYNPAATTHTLETHIYRLRRKIEKDLSHFQLLLTEGCGYRLNA